MDEIMAKWREGLLSNGEVLLEILHHEVSKHAEIEEIAVAILSAETKVAEDRWKKLGV